MKNMLIQDGDYVLFQLPSSNRKLVKVKKEEEIELGKFGSFKAHLLIGKRYEQTFAIQGEEIIEKDLQLDIELEVKEGSNENINDLEGNQKLTFQEIEKMKMLASGTEIVQSIIENHADFDKKTTFAKNKYLKRKGSKFIKGFTAQKITARRLLEYFSEKNLARVKEIRIDTLSQISTLLNLRAGCKYLTVDDTNGIIVAAILERLQGYGQVYNMSEHENGKLDAPKYLNYSPQVLNYIMYPWNRIDKQQDELVDLELLKKDDSEIGVKKFERISNKLDIIKSKRAEFLKADFDGLAVASHLDPIQVLTRLRPFLKGSVPVVIYAQFRESLYEAYAFIRGSNEYVDCQLSESWMREYQIPSSKGGMHPEMMTSGRSGYILTAITAIIPKEEIIPMHSKKQKKV